MATWDLRYDLPARMSESGINPVKVRWTVLALEYKSGIYGAWNSKIFPSETFDTIFSCQAKLLDPHLRQKTHATVTTLRG